MADQNHKATTGDQIELMDPTGFIVPARLIILGLPIIASMISRTIMGFVDFIMVSQLGTDAQAAIIPAGILLFCVLAFGMGLLSVVNTFVAQNYGRGEKASCSAYTWQGVYISIVIGFFVLPGWYLANPFFAWVGHEFEVAKMEAIYVQIGVLGVAPTLICVAVSNFFNGIHKPVIGFWAAVIGNIINVIANYALIFGKFGLPTMGIAGAAWGTFGAAIIQMLILLGWFLLPRFQREYATAVESRINLARLYDIIRIGFPAGVQFMMDVLSFTVFTLFLIGRFGTEQLAANNLTFKCLEISFMPVVGMGVALTAAIGKSIGEGRLRLARIQARWVCGMSVAYMGCIAASLILFNHQFAGLLSDDPEVILWASRMLIICAVFQVFDAVGITYSSALRGAGDTFVPAIMMVTNAFIVFMGGGFIMVYYFPQLQSMGPWYAATAYICILGIAYSIRFAFGAWERITITSR
ncbi:Multidrug resistance protein MdtK [Poriferisphaera corsica]|uniref:Multidrug-efflux transporter n=1 Tax=Poriferisphaera corsica TaxID=2528020 RepID=A0A517YP88_9BACT|nr:MATE family efflux transporter [Poriferisphaera corsica]QDU32030.1 Multidrug resistance protein MdtK [Poriferisphaera corsica]